MRVLIASQARKSPFHCTRWSGVPTNASREDILGGAFAHDVYHASFDGDFDRAAAALLRYQIFARHRMYPRVCTPDGIVVTGATIVQRVVFWPFALETGVRVVEFERNVDRAFLCYATLQGHPERGIASFAVSRGPLRHTFEVQAWSRPGNVITNLARPLSRALQRSITREAVAAFCEAHTNGTIQQRDEAGEARAR